VQAQLLYAIELLDKCETSCEGLTDFDRLRENRLRLESLLNMFDVCAVAAAAVLGPAR
jgi:hypothetical protein